MKKFIKKTIILIALTLIIPVNPAIAKTDQIATSYFENIELFESLPKTFYKDEIYLIKGKILNNTDKSVSAILQPYGSKENITFTTNVIDGKFSIPVFFSTPGNYYLGIVPGEKGDSRATKINVKLTLPLSEKSTPSPTINSLKMNYVDNKTITELNTTFPSIKKVTFVQKDQKVSYLSRQNTNSIPINYLDFKNFTPGKIYFYAEVARLSNSNESLVITSPYTRSGIKFFTGIEHTFSETRYQDITANPPDKLDTIKNISFSGKVMTDTRLKADIIKPDGFVDTINLKGTNKKSTYGSNAIIKSGSNYNFSYTPKTKGRYILEISNKEGLPILNHPTYIGTDIPIIPDFFDLNTRKIYKTNSFSINLLRDQLLNEINKSRTTYGLGKIIMDSNLNDLAQNHSSDMSKNNYFSHYNLKNQSPDERRVAANLKTPVSENIAKDIGIEFAHEGLMRSGSHRSNILEKDWDIMGIGITKKNGYFYVTEEFSTTPLTSEDLSTKKIELLTKINNNRKLKKVPELKYSPSLEAVAKILNTESIKSKKSLTTNSLSNALDKKNIEGRTLAIGRTYVSWDPILKSILESEDRIRESKWKTIGIDIQINANNNITVMIIINNS